MPNKLLAFELVKHLHQHSARQEWDLPMYLSRASITSLLRGDGSAFALRGLTMSRFFLQLVQTPGFMILRFLNNSMPLDYLHIVKC